MVYAVQRLKIPANEDWVATELKPGFPQIALPAVLFCLNLINAPGRLFSFKIVHTMAICLG
jgi:hypothetical protein